MIVKADPDPPGAAATIQIDSDASDNISAIGDIDVWAVQNGYVRTSEYQLRQVLVGGRRRFRGICYRISDDERSTLELAHSEMVRRSESLRGVLPTQVTGAR